MAKSTAKKKKKAAKKKAAKKATKKKAAKKATKKKAAKKGSGNGVPADDAAAKKQRSADKRRAAMAVVASTSDRMAAKAKTSVYAISSEKTLEQYDAIEARSDGIEADRMTGLIDLATLSAPAVDMRRSARDQFGSFRNELSRPEDDPDDVHSSWRMANQRLRHEMSPPAPLEDLEAFEARIRKKLPPSYWDFCLEWNGGLLYVSQGGRFRVLAPNKIMPEMRGPLCGRMPQPYLPVVDLGCNDYLALDMAKTNKSKENPLYWWYAGDVKRKVADSFALWLKRVVDGGGAPYWWNL